MGSQCGALLCFRERESENIRKWQQMKLAGCGELFPPARSNEQALRTDGGNSSLEGPEPSPLSGVFLPHTCRRTRRRPACSGILSSVYPVCHVADMNCSVLFSETYTAPPAGLSSDYLPFLSTMVPSFLNTCLTIKKCETLKCFQI